MVVLQLRIKKSAKMVEILILHLVSFSSTLLNSYTHLYYINHFSINYLPSFFFCTTRHQNMTTTVFEQTNCLNEDTANNHSNIFTEGASILESDADEQILLRINFKTACKVAQLKIACPEGETMPSKMKIFINTPELGFDDVSTLSIPGI